MAETPKKKASQEELKARSLSRWENEGGTTAGGRMSGKSEPITVRLQPELLAILDKWIAEQADPKPSRPEAIRRLLKEVLPTPNTTRFRGEFDRHG